MLNEMRGNQTDVQVAIPLLVALEVATPVFFLKQIKG